MTTIVDAPNALGTYMLKGWILTDRPCTTSACNIPLLRSPAGQEPAVHFCVSCDENPNALRQPSAALPTVVPQLNTSTSTVTSSGSHLNLTRASTPATEVSVASDDLPPFVESEESRRRREQTDRASVEIGRRLLQGWTMLGDECPREACYFVPLVRPPKTAGEPDPKKECVLCGGIYTTGKDLAGRETLTLVNAYSSLQVAAPTLNAAMPVPTHGAGSQNRSLQQITQAAVMSDVGNTSSLPTLDSVAAAELPVVSSSIARTLEASKDALQLSLQTLTTRLTSLSSNPTLADPASIAITAEAISKVTQALSQVKQLQWSEIQAHSMS